MCPLNNNRIGVISWFHRIPTFVLMALYFSDQTTQITAASRDSRASRYRKNVKRKKYLKLIFYVIYVVLRLSDKRFLSRNPNKWP